jgi:Ca2+-binding EF-hand superfamily protein
VRAARSDGSGSIPTDELVGIIQNNGKRMRQEEIDDFRAECDPQNSGRCNYQQFIQILTGAPPMRATRSVAVALVQLV